MEIEITDIGHAIQLAIALVLLLAALGTVLVVLTNRLARIIDRTRVLEAAKRESFSTTMALEIRSLYQRAYMINYVLTPSCQMGRNVNVDLFRRFKVTLDTVVSSAATENTNTRNSPPSLRCVMQQLFDELSQQFAETLAPRYEAHRRSTCHSCALCD